MRSPSRRRFGLAVWRIGVFRPFGPRIGRGAGSCRVDDDKNDTFRRPVRRFLPAGASLPPSRRALRRVLGRRSMPRRQTRTVRAHRLRDAPAPRGEVVLRTVTWEAHVVPLTPQPAPPRRHACRCIRERNGASMRGLARRGERGARKILDCLGGGGGFAGDRRPGRWVAKGTKRPARFRPAALFSGRFQVWATSGRLSCSRLRRAVRRPRAGRGRERRRLCFSPSARCRVWPSGRHRRPDG